MLIASDSGYFSILILLDLSAAFDTVDHLVLITRLDTVFGVSIALNWFRSYLSDRKQFVSIGGFRSKIGVVQSGVPQGSILGPLLFNIYIFTLGQLLRSLGLKFHLYADDTQYLSELLIPYTPTRDLRSSETGLLTVPLTRLRSMGDRAFSSLAPKRWNSLPIEIRQAKTLSTFKSRLKTHFFGGSF